MNTEVDGVVPQPPPPQARHEDADDSVPPAPPTKRQKTGNDDMAAALSKISAHIGNPKKFSKASTLLRQLFSEEKLSGAHGDMAFECLKRAMQKLDQSRQTELRKEYVKLFTTASKHAQIFSEREKAQLDVYGLFAVLRNQLETDDSFVFNRILGKIKQTVQQLPELTETDETTAASDFPRLAISNNVQDADSEPQSIDFPETGQTWTEAESSFMKREALLACFEAAKEMHSKLWARTSVEIAFEEAHKHKDKFSRAQHPRLDALLRFTKEQRLARQQGRSVAREDRRDRTAFESAQREWSKTTGISARGAVGSGGDHHSEVWLG